jgi:hypothetical protein
VTLGRLIAIAIALVACSGPHTTPVDKPVNTKYAAQVVMDLRQLSDLECACADKHDEECSRRLRAERDDYYQKIDRTQRMTDADNTSIDVEEKRFKDCSNRVRTAP